MLDHHQRLALRHPPDQRHGIFRLTVAHPCGRFIEQDHAGAASDRHTGTSLSDFGTFSTRSMVPTRMSSLSTAPIETRGFIAAGKNPVASVVSILAIVSLLLRRHGDRFDLDQIFGASEAGHDDRSYGRRGVSSA